jgi:hypothetical protein
MHRLKWFLLFSMTLLFFQLATGKELRVTKVTNLGTASKSPVGSTVEWAPQATKLAYVRRHEIVVADTMGTVLTSISFRGDIRKWEWLSNSEIVLEHLYKEGDSIDHHELVQFDLTDGSTKILEKYRRLEWYVKDSTARPISIKQPKTASYPDGPAFSNLTTASTGVLTYMLDKHNFFGEKRRVILLSERREKGLNPPGFVSIGIDALYMVNPLTNDSTKISNKPYKPADEFFRIELSPDTAFAMIGGVIIRLRDDSLIILDTILSELPPGTAGCGITPFGFNPKYPEVLFRRGCDDGHNYGVRQLWTYDYYAGTFSRIDTLISTTPFGGDARFSPNGLDIVAHLGNGKLVLVQRGER